MTSFTVTFLHVALIDIVSPQPQPQIATNAVAAILNYPFMANIRYTDAFHCGGTIISRMAVLTAAHCFNDVGSNTISVRVGSAWHSQGTSYAVSNYIRHQQYNRGTSENDLAIVKTTYQMTLGTYVQIATLATTLPAAGSDVIVLGWGSYYEGSPLSGVLRHSTLELKNRQDCINTDFWTTVTKNIICATDWAGKTTCPGDSGGPMIDAQTKNLIGVISYGWCNNPKGTVGMPVPVFYNWIVANK